MGSEMVLALDVGNTEIHVGLFREAELVCDWRVATHPVRASDDYAHAVAGLLADVPAAREDVGGIVIGSVVPAVTAALQDMGRLWFRKEPVTVGVDLRIPIEICTRDPRQVGADRIANAVAGCLWREPPLIVVDLGTATTFDVVARGARYLGGVICPGVVTSLADLVRRTAKLPEIEIREPARVIGRDTEECMRSGIVFGSAEMIDGMVRRIRKELGEECPVIVTGGLGPSIAAFCSTVDGVDRHLTLKGLKVLFDLNA